MIQIDVSYYDKAQKAKFSEWSQTTADRVAGLVTSGLSVSREQLMLFAMYRDQAKRFGYRSIAELQSKLRNRQERLEEYFGFDGTISALTAEIPVEEKERLGVGVSLIAATKIFQVTEADWTKIPEVHKNKTLDFRLLASTGSSLVEVESKGSVVDGDTSLKTASISKMKAHIEAKKLESGVAASPGGSRDGLLGAILAISTQDNIRARCWLVDPPDDSPREDPRRHRLLARLAWYLLTLNLISSSQAVIALASRFDILRRLEDPERLTEQRLVGAKLRKLKPRFSRRLTQFSLGGIDFFARAIPMGRDVLVVGLPKQLLASLVDMNHDVIREVEFGESNSSLELEASLSIDDSKQLDLDVRRELVSVENGIARVPCSGNAYFGPGGTVLGILSPGAS